jgi:hypothetical protein
VDRIVLVSAGRTFPAIQSPRQKTPCGETYRDRHEPGGSHQVCCQREIPLHAGKPRAVVTTAGAFGDQCGFPRDWPRILAVAVVVVGDHPRAPPGWQQHGGAPSIAKLDPPPTDAVLVVGRSAIVP